jgi:hypothetical protein
VRRHHVLERGERVIVAGTSVPNLELHHRMLMAAIDSDPRVLDGSLRKPVVVLVHADSDRLMLKRIKQGPAALLPRASNYSISKIKIKNSLFSHPLLFFARVRKFDFRRPLK